MSKQSSKEPAKSSSQVKIGRNDDLLEAQAALHEIRPTRGRGQLSTGWLGPQICWALYKQFGVLRQLLNKVANKCITKGWRWEQDGIGYDWSGVASDLESLRFSTRLKSAIKWAHIEGGAGLVYRLDETQRSATEPEASPVDLAHVRGITKIEVYPGTRLKPVATSAGLNTWDTCDHFLLTHPNGKTERIHRSRITPIVVDDIPMGASMSTLYSSTTGWPPSWIDGVVDSLQSWRDGEATVDKLLHTISLLVIEMQGAREQMTSPVDADRADFRALMDEIARILNVHGVMALPAGDKLGQVGRNVAGVDKLMEGKRDTFVSDVGYSAEIVLMRTTSGLGDTGGGPRLNDHETIEGLQESVCTPAIDQATEFVLAGRSRYEEVEVPTQWVIGFNPLATETPAQKAAARESNAKSRVQDIAAGVPPDAVVSDSELAELYPRLPEILEAKRLAEEESQARAQEANEDPSRPPANEELVSAFEIGRRLGVSSATIRALRSRGTIRGWKVGGRWRFAWSQVQAVMSADPGSLAEAVEEAEVAEAVEPVEGSEAGEGVADAIALGLEISANESFGSMFGASDAMREIFAVLERVAPTTIPVLLLGETGTGKEGAARGLHEFGVGGGPFVAVNCAALSSDAATALLGDGQRPGLIEQANGGTLFLDEVGELSDEGQAVLLRALSGEVRRMGGASVGEVRIRVVSATWREIGIPNRCWFRRDLYERLAGVVVEIPPLREREGDVLVLAEQMLERTAQQFGVSPAPTLSSESKAVLLVHPWPGNVRELSNAIRRAVVFAGAGAVIEPGHLQLHVGRVP